MERFVGVLQLTTHMPWKPGVASTNWTNHFYPFDKCTTNALVLESVSSERLLRSLLSTYLWAVKAGYPYYFCWALSIYCCELSSTADYDGKQNDHWFLHTDEAKFCRACDENPWIYVNRCAVRYLYAEYVKKMNDGLCWLTRAISQSFFSKCTNIKIISCWFIYQNQHAFLEFCLSTWMYKCLDCYCYLLGEVPSPSTPNILMELSPQFLTPWIVNVSDHGDTSELWLQINKSKFNYLSHV